MLAFASFGFTAPSAFADEPPKFPEYQRPAAPTRRFAASRATIEIHERLPKGEPSIFAAPAAADGKRGDGFGPPPEQPATVAKEELTRILDRRLGRSLGGAEGELVVDVTIVEAKGRLRAELVTSVTLDLRVRRPGGPSLVATRAVSRLTGYVGGMSGDMDAMLLAALLDAFERGVLRDEFVLATNQVLEAPPTSGAEPLTQPERIVPGARSGSYVRNHAASASGHVAAVTFDAGKAYAFGLRYLHDHYSSNSGFAWGGYGVEARGLTSGDSFGGAGLLVLRGGIATEQAFSLEVAGGVAGAERAQGMVLVGLFFSFYYVDLGVSFQGAFAPAENPDWMAPVNFGLRINVPFSKSETSIERRSPLPAGNMTILPGFSSRRDGADEID